jgi:hypothetical protein
MAFLLPSPSRNQTKREIKEMAISPLHSVRNLGWGHKLPLEEDLESPLYTVH